MSLRPVKNKTPKKATPPSSRALPNALAGELQARAGMAPTIAQPSYQSNAINLLVPARQALKAGKLEEAETQYRAILKTDPRNPHALMSMGMIMQRRMRWADALKFYRKSIKFDATIAEAQNGLGLALQFFGKHEKAIDAFDRALELDPGFIGVLNNKGIAYREMGNFEKAASFFEQTLEKDPNIAEAWNGLSRTRKFDGNLEHLETLKQVASNPGLSTGAKRNAWFALGKFCDDAKLYDEAFDSYKKANAQRLVPASWEAECAQMARTSAFYSNDYMVKIQREVAPSTAPTPVFILGMPRSGTTLVEQIIASHPKADWGGELHFFGKKMLSGKLAGKSSLGIKSKDYPERLENLSPRELKKLQKDFFAEFKMERDDRKRNPMVVTDKTPFNFLYMGLIAQALPNAKFIHCRRNLLDTALSIYFTDFTTVYPFATSLDAIGRYIMGYEALMSHWAEVLPDQILDLDYEDLVQDQDTLTRRIINFCDLPWHDKCLSFHETTRHVSTPSDWQVRQPIYNASISRWRHYEKHLGPLIEIIGRREPS